MRGFAAVLALTLFPLVASGQWVAGTHYEVLPGNAEQREDSQIEVIEAFWYGCPSCYNFEPHLVRWLAEKPADVAFVRVAASLAPAWRTHARAYYTAQALGVLEDMHPKIFQAIHIARQPMNTPDEIALLFAEHAGVDAETFRRSFQSFAVETDMRRGDNVVRRYRLLGVPTVVVNGRYRTSPGMARGYAELVQLINHLVTLERQRIAGAAGR